MIKITHKKEAITIQNIPLEVAATVVEIVTILDDNYGDIRDDHDSDGGNEVMVVIGHSFK